MSNAKIWTTWDWRTDPEAPLSWTEPDRRVVVVDDFHLSGGERVALSRATQSGVVAIVTERPGDRVYGVDYPWDDRQIPALRVERQADLAAEHLAPLMRVRSKHRALVITPREAIDLDPPTCETCGGRDVSTGDDVATPFCREHESEMAYGTILDACAPENDCGIDLVIVQGPTGPDAWPMHPAWVRAIKEQCADAGVAFTMLTWGDWLPISEALPGDERRASSIGDVWPRRAGDTNDLPMLCYHLPSERSRRTLDDVEYLDLS